MEHPLATFETSWQFAFKATWKLYPERLECHTVLFWVKKETWIGAISRLEPKYSTVTRLSRYLYASLAVLGICIISLICSHWITYPHAAAWIWKHSIRWININLFFVLLTICMKEREIIFPGRPPIAIKYAKWQRSEAERFADRIVEQISGFKNMPISGLQ
jgi:hypothetical protein